MIFSDIGVTLRISAPLLAMFLAQGIAFVLSGGAAGLPRGLEILLDILNLIASLWVAVAWHRYVLLAQYPEGLVPEFRGGEMIAYFGKTLLLMLIIVLPFLAVFALGMALSGAERVIAVPVIVMVLVAIWVMMRLSVLLPAAAVGRRLSVAEAWQATRPISFGVLGLALLIILVSALVGAPVLLVLGGAPMIVAFAGLIVVQWFFTLLWLSAMTTLFGVFVEGRALD
ncbi:hypothetical protein [Pseudodonghicola flavimaris]|uniref:Glycerophosphoryl diester phosphodiesterase membrane domain-containing protein n=1 Tax=Pseudodonghicola flavimaris TaxID=3050036 RepID=A0ABT7EZV1_9RHOB|nr:hypothetical protein [Pseudodonghicola flavimaris]MDK3017875.1 hypothetical protein [Pseudodonghicola flavimaris]